MKPDEIKSSTAAAFTGPGFIIDELINTLDAIENRSMNKLNQFILREAVAKETKLSKEEILSRSGCESVVYVKNAGLIKDWHNKTFDQFPIGFLVRCPFWMNQNQLSFISNKISNQKKKCLTLDEVNFKSV